MMRRKVLRMSCNAAPCSEVMIPTRRGSVAMGRFRRSSNKPSCSNFLLSASKASNKLPAPARRRLSTCNCRSPRGSYRLMLASTSIFCPASGVQSSIWLRRRNMTQRICACASLSEKYQCPELARVKLDTSPLTQSGGICRLSVS